MKYLMYSKYFKDLSAALCPLSGTEQFSKTSSRKNLNAAMLLFQFKLTSQQLICKIRF